MKANVPIQETYNIPSNGVLYDKDTIPGNITLRAMTAMDEKIRLATTGFRTMPELIKSCIVSDKEIDTYKMKLFDLQFLMYKLRTVTYGPDYKITIKCPNCGRNHEIVVNLDDIPVRDIGEDFKEPFDIGSLPVSGDIITCKIMSVQDFIDIDNEANRIRSKFPDYIGDPELIITNKYRIATVNGEALKPHEIRPYIENMHARDFRYLDSKYNEVVENIGLDINMSEICKGCGETINYRLPLTSEFFRPEY